MLSTKQAAHFRHVLKSRIAELERTAAEAQQQMQGYAHKQADPADQAASEYERQVVAHRAMVSRNLVKTLTEALKRLEDGSYGQCLGCGGDIEQKRLEAIPWARYCVSCQETREQQS